ncbi:MAG TPA: hypothetical protein VHF05_00215 [Candidatus Paceibacterota bacterium]|jgi:hypothetical protein|nr:hypothetical protein [Candidatus Paceibacterota bacterium]
MHTHNGIIIKIRPEGLQKMFIEMISDVLSEEYRSLPARQFCSLDLVLPHVSLILARTIMKSADTESENHFEIHGLREIKNEYLKMFEAPVTPEKLQMLGNETLVSLGLCYAGLKRAHYLAINRAFDPLKNISFFVKMGSSFLRTAATHLSGMENDETRFILNSLADNFKLWTEVISYIPVRSSELRIDINGN